MGVSEKLHEHVRRFINAVRDGKIPDREDMEAAALVLEEVFRSKGNPRAALGIKRGRGAPKGKKIIDQMIRVHEVLELRRLGLKRNDALDKAFERFKSSRPSMSRSTLEHWLDNKEIKGLVQANRQPLEAMAVSLIMCNLVDPPEGVTATADIDEFFQRFVGLDTVWKNALIPLLRSLGFLPVN